MLNINRLKELNQALEENLISQEEYEEFKKNILNQSTQTISNYDLSQILGISGSTILFLGIFAPIVENTNLSNTYYSFLFVVLTIASLICSITKKYKVLWVTGVASLTLITLVTIKLLNVLENNLLFQPQWGIAIIIIGSILILSAAYRQHNKNTKEKIIKSIRNALAYILLFSSINALLNKMSDLITGDFFFSLQDAIIIIIISISGFFLLTIENRSISFFKSFVSIVIGWQCFIVLQDKEFFTAFVFVGIILVLQYEKIQKSNEYLNEKARKRRVNKRRVYQKS